MCLRQVKQILGVRSLLQLPNLLSVGPVRIRFCLLDQRPPVVTKRVAQISYQVKIEVRKYEPGREINALVSVYRCKK